MDTTIGFISGDWHWHIWKTLNKDLSRTLVTESFIERLFKRSHEEGIPILFTGDMFHTPKGITTGLLSRVMYFFKDMEYSYPNAHIYGISGNHDLEERNTDDSHSLSLFKCIAIAFPKIVTCIDYKVIEYPVKIFHHIRLCGIPYLTHGIGMKKIMENFLLIKGENDKFVLLIHSDLPGAKDTNNREINSYDNIQTNLGEFFKGFDLVLSGHIHKYQELWKNKVYMIGAPNHQRKTDIGCEMFFAELKAMDLSIKPIKTKLPEFKIYQEGEDYPDDGNFWIMIPKPKKIQRIIKSGFITNNKVELAKRYIKEKNIKSPKKLDALINILNRTDD